jgi:hypothetical protein
MYKSFKEIEGKFVFAKHMEGTDIESIEAFLHESVKEVRIQQMSFPEGRLL